MGYEHLKKLIYDKEGFLQHLPIEVQEITLGKVKAVLLPRESNQNPYGTVHGGCYFATADTLAGIAAMTHGSYVTTISGHIHYIKGAPADKPLYVETIEVHAGRTVLTYDVCFRDEEENLVCKVTLEYLPFKGIEEME